MGEGKWYVRGEFICNVLSQRGSGADMLFKVAGSKVTALVLCTLGAVCGGESGELSPRKLKGSTDRAFKRGTGVIGGRGIG